MEFHHYRSFNFCIFWSFPQMVKYLLSAEKNHHHHPTASNSQNAVKCGAFFSIKWLWEALVDVWRLYCLNPKFIGDTDRKVRDLGVSHNEVAKMLTDWQSNIISMQHRQSSSIGDPQNLVGFRPAIITCTYVQFIDFYSSILYITILLRAYIIKRLHHVYYI